MNVFKQLYKSIYSPKDIASFRNQGIGKTILYVFLLTFISVLPTFYYLNHAIVNGIETAKQIASEELPDFTIKNGTLEADIDKPVTIQRDSFSITLDPTGAVTGEDLADTGNTFGFLKNEFTLSAGGRTQSYPYAMLEGSEITKNDFLEFFSSMNGIKGVIMPIVFAVIFIMSSALKFIEVSVLAGFGIMFSSIGMRQLQYRHLWRMAAYSVTLSTIFFTIMEALQTIVPNGMLINWFVSSIVLYLAIKETPGSEKEAV
ncbi:hypothetical protein A8F94_04495 [Bacillus sp. FJAT-27225]|uniref:DUF1189 domain-containing protein n=1 Tax=Bacillus sp. FJAT-27225 TaxID=1743144 RepID=UPI00080C23A1|nr:DUF1189 domain-containing protein [Bacillus sp. FJAT-27225]OCA91124.1 hypothetical protein A8F94_04495 [Bacillus sp. FJAT-27225]